MGAERRTVFSSALVVWALLFNLIGFFTWGFGPLTFCCLMLTLILLYVLSRSRRPAILRYPLFPVVAVSQDEPGRGLRWALRLVLLLTLITVLLGLLVAPNNWLMDIGLNTYLAAESLLQGHNPYATHAQDWYTIDTSIAHVEDIAGQIYMFGIPYYYGFPYFPMMVLSYTPFTFLIDGYDAIRWANLLLVVLNVVAIRLLVAHSGVRYVRITQWRAIVAYLCILVYGIEIFWHGIVDILLSSLLLYCFVFLQRGRFVLAGVLLGLAQAAKLLPPPLVALCIMLYLLGQEGFWKFCIAYALTSVLVMSPFVVADPQAFLSATILFYLTNHGVGDNTSLWFFLPALLQKPFLWLGYLLTLLMIPVFVRRGRGDLVDVMSAVFASYLVFMAFSKMTHLNYLWSVYPLGCVAFALLLARLKPDPA